MGLTETAAVAPVTRFVCARSSRIPSTRLYKMFHPPSRLLPLTPFHFSRSHSWSLIPTAYILVFNLVVFLAPAPMSLVKTGRSFGRSKQSMYMSFLAGCTGTSWNNLLQSYEEACNHAPTIVLACRVPGPPRISFCSTTTTGCCLEMTRDRRQGIQLHEAINFRSMRVDR